MPEYEDIIVAPQPGPQTEFLQCSADVVIFGGGAGGGKTYAILLEPLKDTNLKNANFGAVVCRRKMTQVSVEGGLWDESKKLYSLFDAVPLQHPHYKWTFKSGSTVTFKHIQHIKNLEDFDGSQITLVIFDELQHFDEDMFWYLFSRNRSSSGISPYLRATCNPQSDSFVKELIQWYIDEKTGYAIDERSGVIRWFIRLEEIIYWENSKKEIMERFPDEDENDFKSFTFIRSKLTDNKILLEQNKNYKSNLKMLPYVERERLLEGNWNVRPSSGLYFKRDYFKIVCADELPKELKTCSGWDFAATDKSENPKANYTARVKMMKGANGFYYILHMFKAQITPKVVEEKLLSYARTDGDKCTIRYPQDPGQAGKAQAIHLKSLLVGYTVGCRVMTGDKVTRAGALSAACERGEVRLLEGAWNDSFIDEAESFPQAASGASPDVIDAAVEAFQEVKIPIFRVF